jgi:dTDP-4-dehydrorhamnose 3,5-epimerase
MLYCHSAAYNNEAEGGLNPHDQKLAINWPVTRTEMSERDMAHPFIDKNFQGVML